MKLIQTKDFETVKKKYIEIIENTPEIEKHARWVYGKHPHDELLRSYIENGEMYLLMDGESIAGVTALTLYQGEDYHPVRWAEDLADDRVAVLHILAACPEYRGKGAGRKIVEEALRIAGENGKKALRLDTLKSNLPAQRMYGKLGFSYRGEQYLYAENTGWTDFLYYERII